MKQTIIAIVAVMVLFNVPATIGYFMGMGYFKSYILSIISVAFIIFIYTWLNEVNKKLNGGK